MEVFGMGKWNHDTLFQDPTLPLTGCKTFSRSFEFHLLPNL